MTKTRWNEGWTVRKGNMDVFASLFGSGEKAEPVTLPHDAMIQEPRDPNCASKTQSGFYPAYTYTYEKHFMAPVSWEGGTQILEFEGVMREALVYINGEFVGSHVYGYSQFFIDMTPHLTYGEENVIRVVARNEELASRWYPGSGIYRDVNLYVSGPTRIVPQKLRLTTQYIEDDYACISASVMLKSTARKCGCAEISVELFDEDNRKAGGAVNTVTIGGRYCDIASQMRFTVSDPRLWSPDEPYLYRYVVTIRDGESELDREEGSFGIRTFKLDARKGLRINGIETKLRGACIHHDNGIIGAATLPDAEYFRAKNLKEAGYNAIRSAHHPVGPAMLKACDELGILVMDELSDMWNVPKNCNDFAYDFEAHYEDEVGRMVDKDYNHPCVVLYSLGNEIPEIGRADGADMSRRLSVLFHKLDNTRYTTAGMNGLLAVGEQLVELQSTIKAKVESQKTTQQGDGAEALNAAMGSMEEEMVNEFSRSDLLSERLEESTCALDVAGYNYLTARHELEHTLHPDRVVMGSETYPPEIASLWEIVERNHSVIGDFTWTGYDYLGEAGIGIPHYGDVGGQGGFPDRVAYCGDINLNAYRRPVSYLREIAYGMRHVPFIAVERPEHYGQKFDVNNWKYADAVDSWTWPGFDGQPIRIRVLSDADEIELFVNDKSIGRNPVGTSEKLTAIFETKYEPGTLKAVAYKKGESPSTCELVTAGEPVRFALSVSNNEMIADGESCAFITADLVDANGRMNMSIPKTVSVQVEGAGTLAGFGSANPSDERSYQDSCAESYDGRVMAVVRSGFSQGDIKVTFTADGIETASVNQKFIR